MRLFEKISFSDRYNIYFLGINVFYRRFCNDKIKNRFLFIRWETPIKSIIETEKNNVIRYYGKSEKNSRPKLESLFKLIDEHDVISFDVFDTAVRRKVSRPTDVFDLLGIEIGFNDFKGIRVDIEKYLRSVKFKKEGTREVTLDEIYDELNKRFGIEKKWKTREESLEIELSYLDEYVYKLYKYAQEKSKKIIFTTDMYLSKSVIEKILNSCGYANYEKIFLSNELKRRKGDGSTFVYIKELYDNKKILHIGDNEVGDVKMANLNGITGKFLPKAEIIYKEDNLDGLSGSFYRSLIGYKLFNGLSKLNLQYEHGYRVGGILCAGYCQYINKVAAQHKADKILFCARDCDIIYKVYNNSFKKYDTEYINISRYSILNCISELYIHDIINRFIIKFIRLYKNKLTISQILSICGYECINKNLDAYDIDPYSFPASINERHILDFLYSQRDEIIKFNKNTKKAAIKYFSEVIKNYNHIIIVDIGWSGTCITALKTLIHKYINSNCEIHGTLLCTSRNETLKQSIISKEISSYVYSPFNNLDLARFMMPAKASNNLQDKLHLPLEYLFTSTDRTLLKYSIVNNNIAFVKMNNSPLNHTDIRNIQEGIFDFCKDFVKLYSNYIDNIDITPYVAFMPLKVAIDHSYYIYSIYKNFLYDPSSVPFGLEANGSIRKFGELFEYSKETSVSKINNHIVPKIKKILFISPEMPYTGAPRSLLRMAKIAKVLGYDVDVWSENSGPFINRFNEAGFDVKIVNSSNLSGIEAANKFKNYHLVICNTIVTYKFASIASKHVPTVWYIREATNIPDFTRNNQELKNELANSKNIFCVSQYAADAIAHFTNNHIHVIENSVEDESSLVTNSHMFDDKKIKILQLGTIEYRKGYDVLIEAIKTLPMKYKDQVELYFAGGFINSGTPFASFIFNKIKGEKNIHYLGIINSFEAKVNTISSCDIVVVASRDESCSLVALEGAMMSKPLIVTENVGAKYIVTPDSGYIVKTGDVISLQKSIINLIDDKSNLKRMGECSRRNYEKFASIESYTKKLKILFEANSFESFLVKTQKYFDKDNSVQKPCNKCIVSLTSYPKRINTVPITILSLINNTYKNKEIYLYLSSDEFTNFEEDLPDTLIELKKYKNFHIKFVEGNLKPHKKYFYAMCDFPNLPIIILDDDVIYDKNLISVLMESFEQWPNCISCTRANFIMFNENKELRHYWSWPMNYKSLINTPSYRLLPTGVGGVLYPPNSVNKLAFNEIAINRLCLLGDDLWLKFMTLINDYQVVVPDYKFNNNLIPDSQDSSLASINVDHNNDVMISNIIDYLNANGIDISFYINKMYEDRFV